MILHTINKPEALEKCHHLIKEDDTTLLLENGVYLALRSDMNAVALRADVEARGLTSRVAPGVSLIDYTDFVRLTVEADKVCAWF